MTQRILVASGNAKKLQELQSLCRGLPVELLSPSDLKNGIPEVEETGDTFLANASLKAIAFAETAAKECGPEVWALADDSGLCVDALEGAPGVRSARFAGVAGSQKERDAANTALLLQRMQGLAENQRGAYFTCVIAIARGDEVLFAVEGRVSGRILQSPDGDGGFGYDPVFYHVESGTTFARMNSDRKAAVSHRGEAVQRLRTVLETVLG